MKRAISNLLATLKQVDAFGSKYAAEFPDTGLGGTQFAVIHHILATTAELGAAQIAGSGQAHNAVLGKAACRRRLHADMAVISDAAHAIVLTGDIGPAGKFPLPHNNSDQTLLNAARAFVLAAGQFQPQFITMGLADDFLARLSADIAAFEAACLAKAAALGARGGATGGLEFTAHQATTALHVLDTIVRNRFREDPAKLAEWIIASHVERHTYEPTDQTEPTPAAATTQPG